MSDDTEPGRLDPRAAERLLDGGGGDAELRALLAAASAPGRPRELAGEDAAVAAFLAAPRPARTSRAAVLRRFLTAKVIAVVGGSILLSGGVAFATGNFPGQDAAPAPSSTPHDRKTPKRGGGSGSHPLHGPSTGPSPEPSPSERGRSAGEHGKTSAPGRQKRTTSPKAKTTPPRGPGNHNGTARPTTPSNSGNPNKKNGSQGNGTTGGTPQSGTENGDSRAGVPLPSGAESGR